MVRVPCSRAPNVCPPARSFSPRYIDRGRASLRVSAKGPQRPRGRPALHFLGDRFLGGVIGLILFPDEAKAFEGEEFVGLLDVFGAFGYQFGLAAGSNDTDLAGAEFILHAEEHAVHHVHGAVVEAGLHIGDGIGADDSAGILDFDAREFGGAREERLGSDTDAGRDDAAQVFALGGDDVKVMAVPKSTTMQGPPYLWNAATPLTMRSAPTS